MRTRSVHDTSTLTVPLLKLSVHELVYLPSTMAAINDNAAKEYGQHQGFYCKIREYALATSTVGARITSQPSDDSAKFVGTTDTPLWVLADPLVDQTGLLVDEGPSQPRVLKRSAQL